MRKKHIKAMIVLGVLAALSTLTAGAKTTTVKLYLPANVEIGGKAVAQGEYRLEIQDDQSNNPTLIFYDGKREVARTQAAWIELPSPAAYDSAVTGKNAAGKVILTKILLKQSKKALALKQE